MAVTVVGKGDETKELIKKRGLTPGRIESSVTTRDNKGKRTTRNAAGEITRIEETKREDGQRVKTITTYSKTEVAAERTPVNTGREQALSRFDTAKSRAQTPIEAYLQQQREGQQSKEKKYKDEELITQNNGLQSNRLQSRIPSESSNIRSGNLENSRFNQSLSKETQEINLSEASFYELGSYVKPTPETKGYATKLRLLSSSLSQKAKAENTKGFEPAAYNAASAVVGFAVGATQLLRPKELVEGLISTIKNPKDSLSGIRQEAASNEYGFFGELTGSTVVAPKVLNVAAKTAKVTYVKAGSKFVPAEEVFSEAALSGVEPFPLAKSVQNIKQRFLKTIDPEGNIYASTASPQKLKGNVAGAGPKAQANLEDPGIYVTPKGEGSPAFLGVTENGVYPKNPTLNPFKGAFDTPTVTTFKAKGIATPAKKALESAGFEAVRAFQEEVAGSGQIVMTKRSIIGQGGVKRQLMTVTQDVETPGGLSVKKGDLRIEAGTSELEAVVPEGQLFEYTPKTKPGKLKGFDQYTKYQGEVIAIREAELLTESGAKTSPKILSKSGSKLYTIEELSSQASKAEASAPINPLGITSSATSKKQSTSEVSVLEEGSTSKKTSKKVSEEIDILSSSEVSSKASDPTSFMSSEVSKSVSDGSGLTSTSFSSVSDPISDPFSSSSTSRSSSKSSTSKSTSQSFGSFGGTDFFDEKNVKPKKRRREEFDQDFFSAEVKVGGKFRRVASGSSFDDVFGVANKKVSNSALASVRFFENGELLTDIPINSNRYRRSKSQKGVFVEKNEFRIDTPGELSEITFSPKKRRNSNVRRKSR